jgi:hypothetical protein
MDPDLGLKTKSTLSSRPGYELYEMSIGLERAQQRAQLPINVKNIRGYASRRTWALWPGMDCLVLSRAAIGPRDAATRQLTNVRSAHRPLGSELWPMGA